MPIRLWRGAVFAFALSLGGVAHAAGDEDPDAAQAFAEAQKLYAARQYELAAKLFEHANELAPHAAVLFNAATAWDQAGNQPRAADCYERALAGDLDGASRKAADKRIKELQKQLAVLVIQAPTGAEVRVAGRTWREFPAKVYVEPGEQSLRRTLPDGSSMTRRVRVGAGETRPVDLVPPPAPPEKSSAPPPAAAPGDGQRWKVAGWVGVGVGAGLGITSALLWQNAKSERDALIEGDASARGRAQTLETWTNVTLVSSVIVGAAGVTVLLIRPGGRSQQGALRVKLGSVTSVSGAF